MLVWYSIPFSQSQCVLHLTQVEPLRRVDYGKRSGNILRMTKKLISDVFVRWGKIAQHLRDARLALRVASCRSRACQSGPDVHHHGVPEACSYCTQEHGSGHTFFS